MLARMSRLLRKLVAKRDMASQVQNREAVIDTAVGRPRDLDDPFSDPQMQARVARLIADKASNKGGSET